MRAGFGSAGLETEGFARAGCGSFGDATAVGLSQRLAKCRLCQRFESLKRLLHGFILSLRRLRRDMRGQHGGGQHFKLLRRLPFVVPDQREEYESTDHRQRTQCDDPFFLPVHACSAPSGRCEPASHCAQVFVFYAAGASDS